jgi:Tfp pilus assembly protein PilO
MPRGFDFASFTVSIRERGWKDPLSLVRLVLAVLVVLNLVAAAFAFHLFGHSAEETAEEVRQAQLAVGQARMHLMNTRLVAEKVDKARGEGDEFLAAFMTPRRTTYSTIVSELQQAAESAGMTWKEGTIAPLDPVKGSDDLSMMTVTTSFEGQYENLLKFVNQLDRSKRFLIIESLVASPQPNGKTLSAQIKINTFVRDDRGGAI